MPLKWESFMVVPAFIGGIGPWELGLVLIIVLVLFGAGKLPQVFEQFGAGVKKFRDAQKDDALDVTPDDEADEVKNEASAK
jgi:sec-independent protein translocase protein TatA